MSDRAKWRAGALACLALCAVIMTGRPARGNEIVMGPYLQNPSQTAITVIWWTDFPTVGNTGRVEYGDGFAETQSAVETDMRSLMFGCYRQEARITGLAAGRTYAYRVRSNDGVQDHVSAEWSFSAAGERDANVHFAVVGDGRTDSADVRARHRAVLSQARARNPQVILFAGDMVRYGSGTSAASDEDWKKLMAQVFCSDGIQTGSGVAHNIPICMAVGNHEIYRAGGGYGGGNLTTSVARFRAVCDNPANASVNPAWNERYYAFWYGPCYFIVLDANNTPATSFSVGEEPDPRLRDLDNHEDLGDGDTPGWGYGDVSKKFQSDAAHTEQYNWMLGRLEYARDNAAFTFVALHPSPYSRGVHGHPDDSQGGYTLRALDPVFRHYGVDAVFTSHDHTVERSLIGPPGYHESKDTPEAWRDESNLNYLVMGNSGHSSRAPMGGWEAWMDITGNDSQPYYSVYFYSWPGDNELASFLDVDVVRQPVSGVWRATFKVVRTNADESEVTEHDAFWIERGAPSCRIDLVEGWNLVSISVEPMDAAVEAVFPASVVTDVWQYDNPGGYTMPATIVPKRGYWVKALAEATLTIAGTRPVDTSVSLNGGWNLVGVVGPGALEPWQPLPPTPPCAVIWGYSTGTYSIPKGHCREGRGFWIWLTGDATIWARD